MDRDSLFQLLTHYKEGENIDSYTICELYAGTVADVADKISNDEMHRLLIVGAFLFNLTNQKPLPQSFFPDDENKGTLH